MKQQWLIASLLSAVSCASVAQTLSLQQALSMVDRHPKWQAALATVDQAKAEKLVTTQYMNPSMDIWSETHDKQSLQLNFPVELPSVRTARQQGADAFVVGTQVQMQWLKQQLLADIERSYYQVIERQRLLKLAETDQALLAQLRHAVKLRVEVGEAARYEAVKAEAEWLNSQNRVDIAKQQLQLSRQLLLEKLDLDYLPDVDDHLPNEPRQCLAANQDIPPLHNHLLLHAADAQVTQAFNDVQYEQALVAPQPTLMVGVEQERGIDRQRVGISMPLPVFHQRDGQVASAKARYERSRAARDDMVRSLSLQWVQAVAQYQIARRQVASVESGLMREATAAFQVAQAAYKYGERGILDYIDAQRTLSTVQQHYLTSQLAERQACVDIMMHLNQEAGMK